MATITGGSKLEAALRDMAAKVSNPATLRVGWLENSTYPDGTPTAMVAAIVEYGRPSIGQPPRPAFRNMIADKSGEWPAAIAGLLKSNKHVIACNDEKREHQHREVRMREKAPLHRIYLRCINIPIWTYLSSCLG